MSHFPIEENPYLGPTSTGKWAQHVPELSFFSGTIGNVTGKFWKGRYKIEETLGHGDWWYWEQLGLWVENYKSLEVA